MFKQGYFWRRLLSNPGRDVWSDEELLHRLDVATIASIPRSRVGMHTTHSVVTEVWVPTEDSGNQKNTNISPENDAIASNAVRSLPHSMNW